MPFNRNEDDEDDEELDNFRVIHSVRSGENLVAMTSSIRSVNSAWGGGGKFDSVRSYQHEFEMDEDEEDDDSLDAHEDEDDDVTELTNGTKKAKGGDDDDDEDETKAVLAFFSRRWKSMLLLGTLLASVVLIGWTLFTAEYEVIKKEQKHGSSHGKERLHQYEYQKEEIGSCEKDGCGLSAQAAARHKNVTTHVFLKNNTTEEVVERDHCGWGDKTKYMKGDSAIHFEARKNVGTGCTYCKNKNKCVYKHPLNAVCLSDSQCMSNRCNKEQLCAKQK